MAPRPGTEVRYRTDACTLRHTLVHSTDHRSG
jgi:hypothetical protein